MRDHKHVQHQRSVGLEQHGQIVEGGSDGHSWMSSWLHLELAKAQIAGHTCEEVFSIGSFVVERPTLNPDQLKSQ